MWIWCTVALWAWRNIVVHELEVLLLLLLQILLLLLRCAHSNWFKVIFMASDLRFWKNCWQPQVFIGAELKERILWRIFHSLLRLVETDRSCDLVRFHARLDINFLAIHVIVGGHFMKGNRFV
jgi:hypothetical protein